MRMVDLIAKKRDGQALSGDEIAWLVAGYAAGDIPDYDDTRIHFVSSQVRYQFASDWSLGIGAFWEEYGLDDTQTGQVLYYMPSSFFLNPVNGDYNAWVGWLNLTYSF